MMWRGRENSTVNVCNERCVTIGDYQCEVSDRVEILQETKTVDILKTVMKGEASCQQRVELLKLARQSGMLGSKQSRSA